MFHKWWQIILTVTTLMSPLCILISYCWLSQPNPVPLPLALKGSPWPRGLLAWSRALSHHIRLPPLLSAQVVAPQTNIFLGGILLSLPMGWELGHKAESMGCFQDTRVPGDLCLPWAILWDGTNWLGCSPTC